MAPIVGNQLHKLVYKNLKLLKHALNNATRRATKYVEAQLPVDVRLQPLLERTFPRRSTRPKTLLQQNQRRLWCTKNTTLDCVRRFASSASHGTPGAKLDRSKFPSSRIGTIVNASAGRAPFASTLRPNLSGGAFPRTAGGLSLGGGHVRGARYFSHGPTAPTQVMQSVSQAMRCFFISGHKAQFDGTSSVTGWKQYKSVTGLQHDTGKRIKILPKTTPGAFVDFSINPTITALTPMSSVPGFALASHERQNLNTEGLLDILSTDFSRALKDLLAVLRDLQRLSALGDLPITYRISSLRVHFPGCDADTVESLCAELGVARGIVGQDPDFEAFVGTEVALLFPFAPSKPVSEFSIHGSKAPDPLEWTDMMSPESDQLSAQSGSGLQSLHSPARLEEDLGNPWLETADSDYESLRTSEAESASRSVLHTPDHRSPLEYQRFEGIYRFIQQCDDASVRSRAW